MLRRTRLLPVVFTEGFPFLEIFANQHFLPQHPLRHSNIWLDENDFVTVQRSAKAHGLPVPFEINPYAHHPRLSPYADQSSSSTRGGGSVTAKRRRTGQARASVRSSTSSTAPSSSEDGAYRVPICATTVHRRLFLFNADQIMLTDHRALQSIAAPAESGGDAFVSPEDRVLDAEQDGVRALRALLTLYPVSSSQHYNINTKKPYYASLSTSLEQIRAQRGFSQRWWGTRKQWERLGGTTRPRELEQWVSVPVQTKLVHLSLLTNAASVLASSVIFTKSGVLHYVFPNSDADRLPQARDAGMDRHQREPLDFVGDDSTPSLTPVQRATHDFFERLIADVRTNNYRVPLYVSSSQLVREGWTLKPNATGVATAVPATGLLSEVGGVTIPDAVEVLVDSGELAASTAAQSFQHLSSRRHHEEIDLIRDQQGGPQSSLSATRAPLATAPPRTRSVFFYHLSQIHLPDPFFFPPAVITAELEHSVGTPIHGMTGVALPFDALRVEKLAIGQPHLAALLSAAPAGLTAASPQSVQAFEAALARTPGHFEELPPLPATPALASTSSKAEARARARQQAESSRVELSALLDAAAAASASVGSAAASASPSPPRASRAEQPPTSAPTPQESPRDSAARTAPAKPPLLKSLLANTDAALSAFVSLHTDPTRSRGRQLWFLATDVLNANGVVDVNATPVEVTVVGDEVVPGYRLNANGLEPLHAASETSLRDGAGHPVAPKRLFNVESIEEMTDVFRSVNTARPC